MSFLLDKCSMVPLYMQLAEQLIAAIDDGVYAHTAQLPTESALVGQTGISKGTIKAAYRYMERLGYVRRIRGSGVYVNREQQADEQALLGDIYTALNLQDALVYGQADVLFRQQAADGFGQGVKLHAAVVDCNIEMLRTIIGQLCSIEQLTLIPYTTTALFSGEKTISPLCRLVITTRMHYAALLRYSAPLGLRIEQLTLVESVDTAQALCAVPAAQPICVLYRSVGFLRSVRHSMRALQCTNRVISFKEGERPRRLERHIAQGLPLVLPEDYKTYSTVCTLELIELAQRSGSKLVPFVCEVDADSMLYLRARVEQLCAAQRRQLGGYVVTAQEG